MKRQPLRKHGLSYAPEYRAWQQMRLRCLDPEHAAYPDYGGRGITVCDRWRDSPAAFVADMGPRNCRWALRKENCRNRRSNRFVEYRGERLTLAEWCERLSLQRDAVTKRLDAGWSAENAFETPVRAKSRNGQAKPITHPCVDCGESTYGTRCQPCENRRRPRDAQTGRVCPSGAALCAALLEGA